MSKINYRYVYNEATNEQVVTFMNEANGNWLCIPWARHRDDIALAEGWFGRALLLNNVLGMAKERGVIAEFHDAGFLAAYRKAFNV